ncbi:hypothetical protein GCM10028791_05810 [Echinicola sediminis]
MGAIGIKKSTSLRLDRELYSYIEKLAKKENRSVNNYIETVLAKATNFHKPNKETRKAMEEAQKEKPSLKRYTDTNELFDDLAK